MNVFISYSHDDSKIATAIYNIVEKCDLHPILDEKDISGGEILDEKVSILLESAQIIVVIISPSSIRSPWVFYEIGRADNAGKLIIPFLTHKGLANELPIFLQKRKYFLALPNLKKFFVSLTSLQLPDKKVLSLYQSGLSNVYSSRSDIADYFWHFAKEAQRTLRALFVTGNFFGAVNLENAIKRRQSVDFRFLLFNPSRVDMRNNDLTNDQYKIQRTEWETVLLTLNRNTNCRYKLYNEYPFWHLIMVDDRFAVVSHNPRDTLGYNSSPVYVFQDNEQNGNFCRVFAELYEIMWRGAENAPTSL
jgi:hypothetical protein